MNLCRPLCVFLCVAAVLFGSTAVAQMDESAGAQAPEGAVAPANEDSAVAPANEDSAVVPANEDSAVVPANGDSAVAQLEESAGAEAPEGDVAPSLMDDAVAAAAAGEFERAIELYEQAADAGHIEAMLVLGAMYLEGFGVEANATIGSRWFSRAAEAGDPLAQYNLGYLCLMGLGRDRNMHEAFEWFRLSAEQGHPDAMHNLALMYEEGLAGPANPALAYFWGRVAEREGATNAEGLAEMFARLDERLGSDERALAEQLAEQWRPARR